MAEVPGIVKQQLRGSLAYQNRLVTDYTQCVKDKAIANATCATWDETVDSLVRKARILGALEASACEAGLQKELV